MLLAKNAIKSIGVSWRYHKDSFLSSHGADHTVGTRLRILKEQSEYGWSSC